MSAKRNPPEANRGALKNTGADDTNSTRNLLLELGAHGLKVFALRPGDKRPAIDRWEQRATNAPQWLEKWPARAGIGVACGPSGLVVIDLDTHGTIPAGSQWDQPGIRDGLDVFAALWERHSPGTSMFDTFTVTTPSGGLHLYFRAPRSVPVRNSAGKIAPMVDVRAIGGYVVIQAELEKGRYQPSGSPADIRPMPQWLVSLATAPKPAERRPGMPANAPRSVTRTEASRRVSGLLRTVANAAEGQRNSTLNWAAFQLAKDDLLGPEQAQALARAAMTAGLTEAEAVTTVMSAAKGVMA
ncbi:bifunctional DNA primase/polymerase [Kocuria sp. cx-455]|uniref:bifunctional DNA primase/polymerase n=1 Tax=Kocuria sp. cx-455 TaxID=2771377 RepID=UPI003D7215B5